MQQTGQAAGWDGTGRKRVEDVLGPLAALRNEGENLAELAHDARNMVTALGLYCDLLEEPGVLATPYLHYGNELRLVAAASRRLVEKLAALDTRNDMQGASLRARLRPAEKGATQAGLPISRSRLTAGIRCPRCSSTTWRENCWPTGTCWRHWRDQRLR